MSHVRKEIAIWQWKCEGMPDWAKKGSRKDGIGRRSGKKAQNQESAIGRKANGAKKGN